MSEYLHLCFNTTFVTVLCKTQTDKRAGQLVSIQLLLLFYKYANIFSDTVCSFQYNFCYCSMIPRTMIITAKDSFNTTFVTVL